MPCASRGVSEDGGTLASLGRGAAYGQGDRVVVHDLGSGASREIASHGQTVNAVALDRSGRWLATGDTDGVVRFGPATGEDPHLLFGHEGTIHAIAFHPDGRQLASGGVDTTVRLWSVPEGTPFHTLAREDLLGRLRALTNYRVALEEGSESGYRLYIEPFQGWSDRPVW